MRSGSTTGRGARGALAALLACGVLGAAAAPAAAAPGWLPPVDLSQPPRNATNADVAMDAEGNLVAAWERDGFPSTPVQASVRWGASGGGFSGPIDLTATGSAPQVAMWPSGRGVAAFTHFDPTLKKNLIQASFLAPAGGFSPPTTIAALPSGFSVVPRVAVSSSGDSGAVAWLGRSEQEKQAVFVSTFSGGAFAPPKELSDPAHDASPPQLAVDAAGAATVVWKGYSETAAHDAVQVSTGSGTAFSPRQDLSDSDAVGNPSVALDASGRATVLWPALEEKPEPWAEPGVPEYFPAVVEARSGTTGGGFDPPVQLSDPQESGFQPQVEIGGDGTAVAVWLTSSEGVLPGVVASVRPPAGAFEAPRELSSRLFEARAPDLAMNAAGAAAVVWETTGAGTVQSSIRPPGGAFSAPVDVSGGEATLPQVAMDDAGDAVAVWTRDNGTNRVAQAAGYDAAPPQLRNLTIPAEGTVGEPVSFSVDPYDLWGVPSSGFEFGDGTAASGSAVSHTYSTPGSYRVTATATDAVGAGASADATIRILASNDFRLGKLKRDKRTGRATLTVRVPGPGGLVLRGRGLKKASRRARGAGAVKLPVRAVGRADKQLRRRGKAKVRLRVVFAPDGGRPAAKARSAVLKKVGGHSRQHRRRR